MKISKAFYIIILLLIAASVFVRGQEPLNLHTIYWDPPAFTWDSASAYDGRAHEISAVRYNSVYDGKYTVPPVGEIEQYYLRKRSLLDTDTFPTRRANAEEFRRGIVSVPIQVERAAPKDVLLIGYAVYSGYGVIQYSGSVIIATDALRKDVPQGGDEAQLLNETIAALSARGELRNVRLNRPAEAYVEILGWTPIRSTGFIYSTRLPAWQEGQTPKK